MINVLYIYGYGSSATNNRTANNIKKCFPSDYNVMCFDYNQKDCKAAREDIRRLIKEHDINLLVGSSLGAFLALTITNIPKIVMNVCWSPSVELPLIGCPTEIADTYKDYEDMLTDCDMSEKFLTMGFFSNNDELLGDRYVKAFENNYGECFRFDTPHRVTFEAIRDNVVPRLDNFWAKVEEYIGFIINEDKIQIYDEL